MIKMLGLDISSSCTGYCIVEDGYLLIDTIGTIKPNAKDCMGKKLVFFEKEIKKLLKKYKPNHVIIEDIFKGPNAKTFKVLSMCRGVIFKVIFEKLNQEPVSVMPTEARKIVGVNGITKEDGFEFVINKYKFKNYKFLTHNDITDSIILALAGYSILINPRPIVTKKKKRKRSK
jgi:Holliday junction resolvasome RuvABC endonuclease subunit